MDGRLITKTNRCHHITTGHTISRVDFYREKRRDRIIQCDHLVVFAFLLYLLSGIYIEIKRPTTFFCCLLSGHKMLK